MRPQKVWDTAPSVATGGIIDRDWIIIIALGIGWGTTFFFNEVLLQDLGPLSVSFARVSLAALTGWAYLWLTGVSGKVNGQDLGALAVLGVTMFAVPFAIYPLGQQYVASGVAGIVNALTPVMVVVVSHFWPGGERATVLKMMGVTFGFVGIALLTLPAFGSGQGTRLFGTLVIVLAPVSYAFAMNWVRRLYSLGMPLVATWGFTFAALALLPVVAALEGVPDHIGLGSWGALLILGVLLTGVAFLVGFSILPRAGATKTSTVTFIAPISALLIGTLVLNEKLGLPHFLGMTAIFLGLLLIDGRMFQRKVN